MEREEIIDTLASQVFSVVSLRPFQKLVIHRIIENDNATTEHQGNVVILPTGGGKSLCFMLPALLVEGLTILVYPLLSLMNDQVRRLTAAHMDCICIRGGQTKAERERLFTKLAAKETRIVVTNAECLLQSQVISQLMRYTISLFVLDEAHTIERWGEGFRPSLASLGTEISHLRIRQILCFTATADEQVLRGLDRLIFLHKKPHYIRASSDRPNISYHVVRTLSKSHTLSSLMQHAMLRPALVFCARRDTCESSCRSLLFSQPQLSTRYYHGGLASNTRKHLEAWFASSEDGVLFATKAFGMGIDVSHIRSVIHFDLSEDVVSFLQESGRAGRDQRQACSIVLLQGKTRPSTLQRILTAADTCFREALLASLQEEISYCNGCDICNHTLVIDREGEWEILWAIALHPYIYTAFSLTRILTDTTGRSFFSGFLSTWQAKEVYKAIDILEEEGKIKTRHTRLCLSWTTTLGILTTRMQSSMLKLCSRRIKASKQN